MGHLYPNFSYTFIVVAIFVGLISVKKPIIILSIIIIASFLLLDITRFYGLNIFGVGSLDVFNVSYLLMLTLLISKAAVYQKNPTIRISGYLKPIFLLIAINLLGAFQSFSFDVFVKYSFIILGVYFGFFSFVRNEKDAKILVFVVLGVSLIHSMYAILQMLVFDFGLFNTDVLLLKLNKYKDGILQEYYLTGKVGFFYRANSFGKYMVFSLMLILIFKSRYFQRKTIYYPLVFVVLLSVFLSVSRHSMVGMLVGLIYLFMVSVNKNKILKNGLVLMLFFAPIVYIFLYDRLMSYANILSVKSIVMDPSMQARFFSWSEIFSVIKSNPLGIGFGGHNHVSDNGYFAVALSSGLLGLAMFIYFIISVFKMSGRRKINYYSHEYHLYIQLYVVVFSVFNLASNGMVVSNIMLLIIFMAIADKIDYMSMARIREMEKVNG